MAGTVEQEDAITPATYRNPVLFADYSDPDVVRVGDTWYMTASSFCNLPGLPVLSSRDLVHWTLISYALASLGPHYDTPRRGGGVWAPSIRYEEGAFSIYFPNPDRGIFRVEARDAVGPWSEPFLVDGAVGSIDPCPFVDTDGSRWMVKAWAKSRAGINNLITLHRLEDGRAGPGVTIIDGNLLAPVETSIGTLPWITIEGPKLYRVDPWYYLFAPAGGVKCGWQGVFRSAALEGPWEARNVLDQGSSAVNGPHQGALVDGPDGRWWFLHFQDLDSWGRVVHLQPVEWKDGWPVIGEGTGRGQPVIEASLPYPSSKSAPLGSAALFAEPSPWQWQANPQPHWKPAAPAGALRLACVSQPAHIWENAAVLTRKLEGPVCSLTVKLELTSKVAGEEAGLAAVGERSLTLTLRHGEKQRLVLSEWVVGDPHPKESSHEVGPGALWLRLTMRPHQVEMQSDSPWPSMRQALWAETTAFWSADGVAWNRVGSAVLPPGRWVGTQVGLYAIAPVGTPSYVANQNGYADFSDAQWMEGPDV